MVEETGVSLEFMANGRHVAGFFGVTRGSVFQSSQGWFTVGAWQVSSQLSRRADAAQDPVLCSTAYVRINGFRYLFLAVKHRRHAVCHIRGADLSGSGQHPISRRPGANTMRQRSRNQVASRLPSGVKNA